MSRRNDRFNRAMRSLDTMAANRDISKWAGLSDVGAGVDRILGTLDSDADEENAEFRETRREQRLKDVIGALIAAGLGNTVPTLLLIVRNTNDRGSSIRELATSEKTIKTARKLYERHRQTLIRFLHVA